MTAGRPRAPLAKLAASGSLDKNPGKYRDRKEPKSLSLGKPTVGLTKREVQMWHWFVREANGYLVEGDRSLLEFACRLRAGQLGKGLDIKEGNMFIRVLSKLGMTPCDRSRVQLADDETPQDPAERFFN